ncbi:unnamed protein product [Strongylus vulgaris]|uniref:Transthyretin/hydroxyisourate hydrolase domain-containing protein n=1 Tax=Strongylus vulgaris TaxID=40348 RepID=A0A3P7JPT0_STRVU|nr:unnamed protein product [Strongylus vulgaris]
MNHFLWALALLPLCLAVREQSIAVKGRFLCGEQPAANVRVKLWEEDSGQSTLIVYCGTVETTPIDPVLKVYHDCNDTLHKSPYLVIISFQPGSRKVKFSLPDKYITEGMVPKKVMDIGSINLELEFMDEGREFIVD